MPSQTPTRTVTRDHTIFTRPGTSAVTYDLSTPNLTIITIPPSSAWTSGSHWHETHTEHLSIIRGTALVTLGKSTWIHTPSDGVIEIPRGQVHEWRRSSDSDPEDLVVKEWTDPADGQKEVFFRMLNSFLTEPEPTKMHASVWPSFVEGWLERCVITMQLFAIFAACDNWPVMFGQEGAFGSILTHLVLGTMGVLGQWLIGLRPVYDEYVSPDLRGRISKTGEALSMKKNG
jgi:quercetin dioxygenase-like cupin family protein